VRPKIVGRREAPPSASDQNVVVDDLRTDRPPATTRRLLGGDGLVIGLIVLFALAAAYAARVSSRDGATSATIFLNVMAVVPLIMGRRWPLAAAATATLITVAIFTSRDAALVVGPFAVMLFLLAQLVARRGLRFAVPMIIPFAVNAAVPIFGHHGPIATVVPFLFLVASLVIGEAMRKRGLAVAELGATQEAMAESIRAQTVMEERARIARELHDIVAHHLSVIAVESEAARLTSPELSDAAGGRLESIAATAREALTETRRLLGVLREDTDGAADRAPQPGLDELDDLVDKARAAGTPVRLIREGRVVRLPLSIDLASYRIVQEALTNARRHAPGADVDVEIAFREQLLHLHVRDHGPGAPAAGAVEGHGLMGMRERAALAGGTFSFGPADGGGFEVDVTLPTAETAA
jgi:signal transduction histidine kinase